jgi:hypothetical protein
MRVRTWAVPTGQVPERRAEPDDGQDHGQQPTEHGQHPAGQSTQPQGQHLGGEGTVKKASGQGMNERTGRVIGEPCRPDALECDRQRQHKSHHARPSVKRYRPDRRSRGARQSTPHREGTDHLDHHQDHGRSGQPRLHGIQRGEAKRADSGPVAGGHSGVGGQYSGHPDAKAGRGGESPAGALIDRPGLSRCHDSLRDVNRAAPVVGRAAFLEFSIGHVVPLGRW